jgi:hypothetical protein
MNNHLWFDAIGWVGAAALLVAYGMVSARKWEGHSSVFQFLNVGGSLLLAANTIFYGSYPSTFVNLVWGSHCDFHNRHQEAGFVSLV